jgi:hypothetical protein
MIRSLSRKRTSAAPLPALRAKLSALTLWKLFADFIRNGYIEPGHESFHFTVAFWALNFSSIMEYKLFKGHTTLLTFEFIDGHI